MSILKTKVLWYGQGGIAESVEVTDVTSITIKKGLDANSNSVTIKVTNPVQYTDTSGYRIHKWIDPDSKEVQIKKNDVFEVYVGYFNDNSQLDSTNLMTTADIRDVEVMLEANKSSITFTCIDKTFNLLNKIWSESYTATRALNAPKIIQNIIRHASSTGESNSKIGYENGPTSDDGTLYTDGTGLFEIDARLVSEGGFIQDDRPTLADDYPVIAIGKAFKPVYSWIEELSQTDFTNTEAEISGKALNCKLKHLYFVDRLNRFHWYYPSTTVDYNINLNTFEEGTIKGIKLKDTVFDVINHVQYNAGKDLQNIDVVDYFFDDTSSEPSLKSKFIPFTFIARNLRREESTKGNITINEDGTVTIDVSSGTTAWGEVYTDDSDYIDKFWNRCVFLGDAEAQRITQQKGSARSKGTITLKGVNYIQGELVNVIAYPVGINNTRLRIKGVTHQISNTMWTTSLDVEEDEKEKQ